MILIIGLGNPGEQYEKTRHNTGFMLLDELKEALGFPEFRLAKEHKALVSAGKADGEDVLLAKPETYMNESGKAAKSLASYFKIKTDNIYVVHDEADLPLGEFKIKEGGTAGGHKGVQSIIEALGSKDFIRLRIGIASDDPSYSLPLQKGEGLESVVLKNFSVAEKELLLETFGKAVPAIISKIFIEK
ncbi:MAG: aminoacyl-tRNA hydrolase [Candidatus Pacebacteria bacterium]|nr:aminoacyl-tRNA hydrolase [Candidatus Paceibacterota bacterium]